MLCVASYRLRQVATWFVWRVIVCDRSPRGLCGELSFTTGRHVVCVASYRLRQIATWFVGRVIVYDRSPRGLCGELSFTTGRHVVCVASYRLRVRFNLFNQYHAYIQYCNIKCCGHYAKLLVYFIYASEINEFKFST